MYKIRVYIKNKILDVKFLNIVMNQFIGKIIMIKYK